MSPSIVSVCGGDTPVLSPQSVNDSDDFDDSLSSFGGRDMSEASPMASFPADIDSEDSSLSLGGPHASGDGLRSFDDGPSANNTSSEADTHDYDDLRLPPLDFSSPSLLSDDGLYARSPFSPSEGSRDLAD